MVAGAALVLKISLARTFRWLTTPWLGCARLSAIRNSAVSRGKHQKTYQLSWLLGSNGGERDTFYRPHLYPPSVTHREPAGYFFDNTVPAMSALLGTDVSRNTLSWSRAAGGIISTTSDMTRWERVLYTGRLLPAQQQTELTSLVSMQTGQPMSRPRRPIRAGSAWASPRPPPRSSAPFGSTRGKR